MNELDLIQRLPDDLVEKIKDFVLTPDIWLELIYQKYKLSKTKLKKMLSTFSSKQLENINWKYLYYKIYTSSPPMCDNNKLQPIFKKAPRPNFWSVFNDEPVEPFLLYSKLGVLSKYKLTNINRSDYYSDKIKTEKGRKRRQYKNIVNSWKSIRKGRGSSDILEIDNYMLNIEYNLIRTIMILNKFIPTPNPTPIPSQSQTLTHN